MKKFKVSLSVLNHLHLYVDPVAEMHFFAHDVQNEVDYGEVVICLVVLYTPNWSHLSYLLCSFSGLLSMIYLWFELQPCFLKIF